MGIIGSQTTISQGAKKSINRELSKEGQNFVHVCQSISFSHGITEKVLEVRLVTGM